MKIKFLRSYNAKYWESIITLDSIRSEFNLLLHCWPQNALRENIISLIRLHIIYKNIAKYTAICTESTENHCFRLKF